MGPEIRWPYDWTQRRRHQSSSKTAARSTQRKGTPAEIQANHRHLDGFYGFLLDRQQRLTSLWLAIPSEAELPQRAFFDLENEQFYPDDMKRTIKKRIAQAQPL